MIECELFGLTVGWAGFNWDWEKVNRPNSKSTHFEGTIIIRTSHIESSFVHRTSSSAFFLILAISPQRRNHVGGADNTI